MTTYKYNYSMLPKGLQTDMKLYIEEGIKAGGFLMACLENDLMGAVVKADANNLPHIQEIVRWIIYDAPNGCWGSGKKVSDWRGTQNRAKNSKGGSYE